MSRATSALFGRRRTSSGAPICSVVPACSTQMRSARAQRLLQIVGDEKHGDVEPAMQRRDLLLQRLARHAVDGGERLVQQQHLRVAGERARQGDALALAARELIGPARLEAGKMHAGEQLRRVVAAPRLGDDAAWRGARCRAPKDAETAHSPGTRARRCVPAAEGRCRPRCRAMSRRRRGRGPTAGGRGRRSSAGPSSCRCPTVRQSPAARRAGSSAPRRAGWGRPAAAAPTAALLHASCAPALGRRASMCTMAMAAIEKASSTADMTPA